MVLSSLEVLWIGGIPMRRLIVAGAVGLIFGSSGAAAAFVPAARAVGPVQVLRGDSFVQVAAGTLLAAGDQVQAGSPAIIVYADGCEQQLPAKGSVIRISTESPCRVLAQGSGRGRGPGTPPGETGRSRARMVAAAAGLMGLAVATAAAGGSKGGSP